MHGFQAGFSFLTDMCGDYNIIRVEEHWLYPFNIHKLQDSHNNFECLCWSDMIEKVHSGLTVGRPLAGLGILFKTA